MSCLENKVVEHTLSFSTKIDRLIKDFGHRFNNFTKLNNQVQYLQTNVNHLHNKADSKIVEKRKKSIA